MYNSVSDIVTTIVQGDKTVYLPSENAIFISKLLDMVNEVKALNLENGEGAGSLIQKTANNKATEYAAVALGYDNTVNGVASFVAGQLNIIDAAYCAVFGRNNKVVKEAAYSNVFGSDNEVGGVISGYSNIFGFNLRTSNYGETAFGVFNETKEGLLFSVGNGGNIYYPEDIGRHNVIEIYANGAIKGETLEDWETSNPEKDLTNKEYVAKKVNLELGKREDLSQYSFVFAGVGCTVYTNWGAVVSGNSNENSSVWSYVGGQYSKNTGNASQSITYGLGLINNSPQSAVFGKYNVGKSNTVLEIGNGDGFDENSRSNAFEVLEDGTVNTSKGTLALLSDIPTSSGGKLYYHRISLFSPKIIMFGVYSTQATAFDASTFCSRFNYASFTTSCAETSTGYSGVVNITIAYVNGSPSLTISGNLHDASDGSKKIQETISNPSISDMVIEV